MPNVSQKANNKGCRDYDPLKAISHLIYLDVNNLYGWAMPQHLPTHGTWLVDTDGNQSTYQAKSCR